MGVFVPAGMGEDGVLNIPTAIEKPDPEIIIDCTFVRHGEQVASSDHNYWQDKLSEEGKERAVKHGKSLVGQDNVFAFCGNTERAKDYLRLILENCQTAKKGRVHLHSSLNALNASLSRTDYENQRKQQIAELVSLLHRYQRSVKSLQGRIRNTILFITPYPC